MKIKEIKTIIGIILSVVIMTNICATTVLAESKNTSGRGKRPNHHGRIDHKDYNRTRDKAKTDKGRDYVKNQLLLVSDSSYDEIEQLAISLGATIEGYIDLTGDYQIEFNSNKNYRELNKIIETLKFDPRIESVSLNYILYMEPAFSPDDPKSELLDNGVPNDTPNRYNWNFHAINALEAWELYYSIDKSDRTTTKIGLIDTIFRNNHEDLHFTDIWENTIDHPNQFDDQSNHGMHVAGIMAAGFNNGKGISGICPENELYGWATRGKDDMYDPSLMGYKHALALMVANNVRVINISYSIDRTDVKIAGQAILSTDPNRTREDIVKEIEEGANILDLFLKKLLDNGYDFVIVMAAGNHGIDAKFNHWLNMIGETPETAYSVVRNHIIVVSAIGCERDINDEPILSVDDKLKYNFWESDIGESESNWGDRVDIVAPGERIYSTVTKGIIESKAVETEDYNKKSGTSMAAPHVAGTAGMMYSIFPNMTGAEVKRTIINCANISAKNDPTNREVTALNKGDKKNETYTYSILDAEMAVRAAKGRRDMWVIHNYNEKTEGIVFGTVRDSIEKLPISGVEVKAYKSYNFDSPDKEQEWVYLSSEFTNEFGDYLFALGELEADKLSRFKFEFSKPGFDPRNRYCDLLMNDAEKLIDVELVPNGEIIPDDDPEKDDDDDDDNKNKDEKKDDNNPTFDDPNKDPNGKDDPTNNDPNKDDPNKNDDPDNDPDNKKDDPNNGDPEDDPNGKDDPDSDDPDKALLNGYVTYISVESIANPFWRIEVWSRKPGVVKYHTPNPNNPNSTRLIFESGAPHRFKSTRISTGIADLNYVLNNEVHWMEYNPERSSYVILGDWSWKDGTPFEGQESIKPANMATSQASMVMSEEDLFELFGLDETGLDLIENPLFVQSIDNGGIIW